MAKGLVTKIIAYESGMMPEKEIIKFFGQLVKSGMAWKLQGSYGRMAANFISQGYISKSGNVNRKKLKELT